jgi:opacity protein-like surface antigen
MPCFVGEHLVTTLSNTINKLYLKIGLEFRHFKVNFTDPSNTFLNLNKSYNSIAFVPGFGLEIDLTPNLSLRMEYRIALHPKKTVQLSNAASQTTSIQTNPTIHHLNLGLAFKI